MARLSAKTKTAAAAAFLLVAARYTTNCNNARADALQASPSFPQRPRGNIANNYLDDPGHPMTYGFWEGHPFTYDPTNGAEHNEMQDTSPTMHQPPYSSPPLEEVDEVAQPPRRIPFRRKSATSQDASPTSSHLLTFDEEKEIAVAVQHLRSVTRARDNLAEWMARDQHSEPSEYQWASACSLTVDQLRNVMARGEEAKTKLIQGNVGLVTMIAKRYFNMLNNGGIGLSSAGGAGGTDATLQLDDLIQTGYMGIMEAAERFDPERGNRFSTYATHWIRQRIVRGIAESSRMIRLPAHVQTMMRTMHKKRKELERQNGRQPSEPELAHEMGVPLDKVTLYKHLSKNVLSLELPVDRHANTEDKRTLADCVASTEMATPDEDFMSESLRGEVHSMLDALGHDERLVLTHRFGLDDGRPKSIRETAVGIGASIDIVRGLEAKALRQLRQPRINYRLKEYVGEETGGELYHEHHQYQETHEPMQEQHHQHYYDYPHHMNDASTNAHDVASEDDLIEYERPTPESIWSFRDRAGNDRYRR